MALYSQLSLNPEPVDDGNILRDIPKEMNIFFVPEAHFLPEGKTYSDLTPEELKLLGAKYRFSYYRPGLYQTISGMGGMI